MDGWIDRRGVHQKVCLGTKAHCEAEFSSRMIDSRDDDIDEASSDSDESKKARSMKRVLIVLFDICFLQAINLLASRQSLLRSTQVNLSAKHVSIHALGGKRMLTEQSSIVFSSSTSNKAEHFDRKLSRFLP